MKNRKGKYLLMCAVLSWGAMPLIATNTVQAANNKDYTVVVKHDKAKEIAKSKSQTINIITKEDIAEKKAESLEDVIYSQTGVNRTVDAMGRVGIAIRGAEARHTLMMVDGVEVLGDVSKYSGATDEATRLGVQNVNRVEIIKGAGSAHYGSGAIGGVVNVITKSPLKKPTIEFNAETTHHNQTGSEHEGKVPKNYFMRVDTGEQGKFKAAFFANKREIMPVYKKDLIYKGGESWYHDFRPSLRFFGRMNNAGALADYKINDHQKISFKATTEKENLKRFNKSAEPGLVSLFEPMQVYKRKVDRDTYDLSFENKGKKTDVKVSYNHSKLKEQDATMLTAFGSGTDGYSGWNMLHSVDWLDHKRDIVNVDFSTYPNEKHTINYGFGLSKEKATGSRIKNADKSWVVNIDPWNFDNSLRVRKDSFDSSDEPISDVHRYLFVQDERGFMWDKNAEVYGGNPPPVSADEMAAYVQSWFGGPGVSQDVKDRIAQFDEELKKENAEVLADDTIVPGWLSDSPAMLYFITDPRLELIRGMGGVENSVHQIKYHGKYYGEDYDKRNNQVEVGQGTLKKQHVYIEDVYNVNEKTTISPIIRLDHSNLFGSNITAAVGMVHKLNGDANKRLKANIGTAYSEPGLGELYYNWQMFGSTGSDRLGWYWIGNKDLQPEHSLNFDISYERDTAKNNFKASLFHNKIKDYMTSYFTGQIIDFTSLNHPDSKFVLRDRIYSFKNLDRAEITGLELEANHKFNEHWSGKLGYTYLHTKNKSDKTMPDKLLNRPTHKIDLSVTYADKEKGFDATIWTDYMIHMLDSNDIKTKDLFEQDSDGNYIKKDAVYGEKTFGIWNAIVNKKFNDTTTAYVGVNNIFNHRDDDRARQDRTYRFGLNYKTNLDFENAVNLDSLNRESGDTRIYGTLSYKNENYNGEKVAPIRFTKQTYATKEAREVLSDDKISESKVKLTFGIDAKLSDSTRAIIEASTDKDDDKGSKLERAEILRKKGQWETSIGKLSEKFGATGYWFNDRYVGARAVYNNGDTEVRIGYGDFSDATGFASKYTFAKEGAKFYRLPTANEFVGLEAIGSSTADNGSGGKAVHTLGQDVEKQQVNYREKFDQAGENLTDPVKKADAKLAVLKEFVELMKNIPAFTESDESDFFTGVDEGVLFNYRNPSLIVKTKDGTVLNYLEGNFNGANFRNKFKEKYGEKFDQSYENDGMSWESAVDKTEVYKYNQKIIDSLKNQMAKFDDAPTFIDENGNELNEKAMLDKMYVEFVGEKTVTNGGTYKERQGFHALSNMLNTLMGARAWDPYNGAPVPLEGAPQSFLQTGKLLLRDQIPEIKRAAYVSLGKKLNPNLDIKGWYLRSFDGKMLTQSDNPEELDVANVFALGATYHAGAFNLSVDYGVNTSDAGKYFNGGRNSKGEFIGGSKPTFFIARLGVGETDLNKAGSWSAFIDYKALEHGSYFGGSEMNFLPDYYLDGIKSMSVGTKFVPMNNLELEATYTFGAKSLDKRDTLFAKREFELGDYSRVKLTYHF